MKAHLLASMLLIGVFSCSASADSWRGQVTPYVWMPSLAGDIRPTSGAPRLSTRQSFSDIFDDLDAAFFLHATARRDRLVLFGDISYASLSTRGTVLPGVSATGQARQTSLTAAAGYQIVQTPDHAVDLLAGARLWQARAVVEIPALGLDASESEQWIDPLLAARLRSDFTPDWSAMLYADIGGFGIGSDATWQLVGTLNYRLNESLYLSAGYRHLALNYDDNGALLDIEMSGPLLGATWRF
ncbi:hypothetical protein SAMN05192555_12125 [Franzmannia pantelleriensis]|uniref:Outer membrane protein beta-barrel domain-containing protein n=1 Tax=Franzmannia pantelleriensis TaxID=48727 RepID=A0A1G9WGQ7_9GAMM|nr:hypothetical protein [Halomonas pantelleriensis]SDM83660.1 hypothetical protein SAMN05192555_12125 [Halomonas pantelleriensis]